MFNWLRSQLDKVTNRRIAGLSLISQWLEHALWTIETKFLALAQQAYGQNEVVFACIRLLSQSVPEPPLMAYESNPAQATRKPLPYDHPLTMLIRQPNPLMTEYEFWELTTIHMAIVGRSTWWKQRNNFGEVIALWPLRPDRVGPIYANDADPEKMVLWGWNYIEPNTGTPIQLPRKDVVAFNFPDPTGESGGIVEGYGPIQALARQVAADNEATKFVGALLANYAAPTVAIKVKAPVRSEAEANLIKSKFRHEFGGANRGTPALLDAETDIAIIGFNLQQLEFPELRNVAEARITAALGVPAILVGVMVGLKAGNNRASVTEQRSYFAETTLSNYWRRYQDQYTADVAREFGPTMVCEFDILKVRAMSAHFFERLRPVREGFEKGVVTRNEYRANLNLPLLSPEHGDVFVVALNMSEVPVTGEPRMLTGGQQPEEMQGSQPRPPAKAIKALDEAQAEAEEKLAAIIGAILSAYQSKAATAIRNSTPFDYAALGKDLTSALEPALTQIALDQMLQDAAGTTIGIDPAEAQVAASEWASEYVAGLVAGLLNTTFKAVEDVARKTKELGLSDEEINSLLKAVFGEDRVTMIAISETTRARANGTELYAAIIAALYGNKYTKVYHAVQDERTCPICGARDGLREGQAGFAMPPSHSNCRCWLSLERTL